MIPSPTVPTPTVDPNTDYTSVDCFVDDKNNRVLSTLAYRTDTNTIEVTSYTIMNSNTQPPPSCAVLVLRHMMQTRLINS